jgi:hypothetical protein
MAAIKDIQQHFGLISRFNSCKRPPPGARPRSRRQPTVALQLRPFTRGEKMFVLQAASRRGSRRAGRRVRRSRQGFLGQLARFASRKPWSHAASSWGAPSLLWWFLGGLDGICWPVRYQPCREAPCGHNDAVSDSSEFGSIV